MPSSHETIPGTRQEGRSVIVAEKYEVRLDFRKARFDKVHPSLRADSCDLNVWVGSVFVAKLRRIGDSDGFTVERPCQCGLMYHKTFRSESEAVAFIVNALTEEQNDEPGCVV